MVFVGTQIKKTVKENELHSNYFKWLQGLVIFISLQLSTPAILFVHLKTSIGLFLFEHKKKDVEKKFKILIYISLIIAINRKIT